MRKPFLIFLAAAMLFSSATVFTGCGGDVEITKENTEIICTPDGNTTKLSWKPVDGIKFSVYRATSRYGNYELVKDNIEGGSYTDGMRYAYYKVQALDKSGNVRVETLVGEELDMFGENVYVFSPEDSFVAVNKVLNEIYDKQYDAEFSARRYAFYFKPGVYDENITLKQAYYTTFAGLGASPEDVTVRSLQSLNGSNGNALINFWRGTENMSFGSSVTWAVSQGAYLRRVNIKSVLDLHDRGGYASGGFLADSYVKGAVNSGSQQQWLSRNCEWGDWTGNVWNMCFLGVNNAPEGDYPDYKYTVVENTPTIREKPHLVFADGGYKIAVPVERKDTSGCSWRSGEDEATYIDREYIYFAKPETDSAQTINAALNGGKHIVFTPGIYELDEPIVVENDNAVLLGTGLATLTPTAGNACLQIKNGNGATVAGLLFDAGTEKSQSLFDAGVEGGNANGVYVFDCFFRVGGAAQVGTAVDTCFNVYADGSVLDNIWLWRADHGQGVGWTDNNGDTGMTVYADDVKAYGLFSEHFKKNNVLWQGERGEVVFYQSEIAYDVPTQSEWMDGERQGYASFKVADSVERFTACGMGVYSNFHNGEIVLDSAVQAPDAEGVRLTHICSVALSKGVMLNVVNDSGGAVGNGTTTRFLTEYSPLGD